MQYRYPLPNRLVEQALNLQEFANGGAQCHARLCDGTTQPGLLISNATAVIAMRGQSALPFPIDDIAELYQTDDDCSPIQRGDWKFFDEWSV
jgi:hypothetical protein